MSLQLPQVGDIWRYAAGSHYLIHESIGWTKAMDGYRCYVSPIEKDFVIIHVIITSDAWEKVA